MKIQIESRRRVTTIKRREIAMELPSDPTDNAEPSAPAGMSGIPDHLVSGLAGGGMFTVKPSDRTIQLKILADRRRLAEQSQWTADQIAAVTGPNGDPTALGAAKAGRLQALEAQRIKLEAENYRLTCLDLQTRAGDQERERRSEAKNKANVVMHGLVDNALATIAAISINPMASASQLAANRLILSIAVGEEFAATISHMVDFSHCETTAQRMSYVTDLYSRGLISADEHSVLFKGLAAESGVIKAELADRLAQLELSESEMNAADRARTIEHRV
ncbi:hypothetical protein [Hoeflea alexandrii]|uniref:hypothetical protein n=1 Tax=Hoeflea alexandrii TaxID=288436 RepID=UPI0020940850|nr:hypothetical protein [Hoeflea alexandrii]MCY0152519.1 hypothetical protein [Hoeflea alexandrii]